MRSEDLIRKILEDKFNIEKYRKKPRVIILSHAEFYLLKKDWIDDVEGFFGDGTLFGMWVIKSALITDFEIR
jgi:hypothetical protein